MSRRNLTGRITAVEQHAAEREAVLVERLGVVMADLVRGVLSELDLTDEQQALAKTVVPERLRLMRESLTAGSTYEAAGADAGDLP